MIEDDIEKELNVTSVTYVGCNDYVYLFSGIDDNGNKRYIIYNRENGEIKFTKE